MALTDRLLIESLSLDHVEELFAALDDPAVGRYLGGSHPATVEQLHARIVRQLAGAPSASTPERWWNWVVRLRDTGDVIGRLEATSFGDWAEVAYIFGPTWGGQGLATEATRWMVDHLAAGGTAEFWAAIHAENLPSRRLAERLGFQLAASTDREIGSYDSMCDVLYVRRVAPVV